MNGNTQRKLVMSGIKYQTHECILKLESNLMQEIMLALLVAVNQYVLISKQIYIIYSLDSIYSFSKRNYLHINNYLQNHQAP